VTSARAASQGAAGFGAAFKRALTAASPAAHDHGPKHERERCKHECGGVHFGRPPGARTLSRSHDGRKDSNESDQPMAPHLHVAHLKFAVRLSVRLYWLLERSRWLRTICIAIPGHGRSSGMIPSEWVSIPDMLVLGPFCKHCHTHIMITGQLELSEQLPGCRENKVCGGGGAPASVTAAEMFNF
jgi:hypothetical protein